jgi:hypothetical protein
MLGEAGYGAGAGDALAKFVFQPSALAWVFSASQVVI